MNVIILSKFPQKVNRTMKNDEDLRFAISIIALLLVVMGLAIVYIATKPAKQEEIFLKAEPIVTEQATEQIEIVEELSGGHETVEVTVAEEEEKEPVLMDEELIAMVVHAEAGNQDMLGKTLVAAVVFNRCDYWGLTVESVVYAENQFAIAENYTEQDLRAVEIAQKNRDLFPDNLLYFRAGDYHTFGEKWEHIGDHYFSLAKEKEN